MLKENFPDAYQDLLSESFTDISEILKAFGSLQRQKILIALINSPKTFQELQEEVNLSKTALSNHLAILRKTSLIGKIHHGYYRLTRKGQDFLQAICAAFEHSLSKEAKEKEAEQKRILMESFLQRKN